MRKKGFTLVELLVVISIIALLMSVLIPSLQKAKLSAEEIVGRSNLRQFGLAGIMYLGDNEDIFPNAWNSIYKSYGSAPQCQWHNKALYPDRRPDLKGSLWDYIGGGGKVHVCPTFARLAKSFGETHIGHVASIPIDPLFSYSMNGFLGGFGNFNGHSSDQQSLVIKSGQVKRAESVFFFAEENCWPYERELSNPFFVRYSATLNDNALVGAPLLPDKEAAWTYSRNRPAPYLDAFGSYHRTTMGKRNNGMANAIFVDGHVQLVEPDRTYYYTKPMNRRPPLQ